MQFLGACDVCNKALHTYRGLGQHLRFNEDAEHQSLKERWYFWRGEYKATLRCRKCGGTWNITDSKERHCKRCPACEQLRSQVGRRTYEKTQLAKLPDPRRLMAASGSKAQWDENGLASQLAGVGIGGLALNSWQSLQIQGKWCPREADIKIPVGNSKKLMVLCDGEAFHGPGYVFKDKQARVADDIMTAEAYFDAGYSVVRYAEPEIKDGRALQHLLEWLPQLQSGKRLYRTWHPPVEKTA